MKGLNMYIKDITKQVFLKNLGFTYLQYLQPNKSLRSLRIVGIYVLTGFTSQKCEKKSKRIDMNELLGCMYLQDIQVKNEKKERKRINIRIEYMYQRHN